MESKTSDADRTAQNMHEKILEQISMDRRTLKCRLDDFSIDRYTASVRCKVIPTMDRMSKISRFLHNLKDTYFDVSFCLDKCVARENQIEQFSRDGRKDECKFTLTSLYLCFRSSVMDEEKRQQFL